MPKKQRPTQSQELGKAFISVTDVEAKEKVSTAPQIKCFLGYVKRLVEEGKKIDTSLFYAGSSFVEQLDEIWSSFKTMNVEQNDLYFARGIENTVTDFLPEGTYLAYHPRSAFNMERSDLQARNSCASSVAMAKPFGIKGTLLLVDAQSMHLTLERLRHTLKDTPSIDRNSLLRIGSNGKYEKTPLQKLHMAFKMSQIALGFGEVSRRIKDEKEVVFASKFGLAPNSFPFFHTSEIFSVLKMIEDNSFQKYLKAAHDKAADPDALSASSKKGKGSAKRSNPGDGYTIPASKITLSNADQKLREYLEILESYDRSLRLIEKFDTLPESNIVKQATKCLDLWRNKEATTPFTQEEEVLLNEIQKNNPGLRGQLSYSFDPKGEQKRKEEIVSMVTGQASKLGLKSALKANEVNTEWINSIEDGNTARENLDAAYKGKTTPNGKNWETLAESISKLQVSTKDLDTELFTKASQNPQGEDARTILSSSAVDLVRKVYLQVSEDFTDLKNGRDEFDEAFSYHEATKLNKDNLKDALSSHPLITSYLHESYVHVVLTEGLKVQCCLISGDDDGPNPNPSDHVRTPQATTIDPGSVLLIEEVKKSPEYYPSDTCGDVPHPIDPVDLSNTVLKSVSDFCASCAQ